MEGVLCQTASTTLDECLIMQYGDNAVCLLPKGRTHKGNSQVKGFSSVK